MSRWQELVTTGRWHELVDDTLRSLESMDCPDRDRINEAIWDVEKVAEMAEPVPLGENPTERVCEFKGNLRKAVFDRTTNDSNKVWSMALMSIDHPESRDPEHRS